MASGVRIRRSLLDRLLADELHDGLVMTQSVDQLRDTVARDVEALLNARAAVDFEQLHNMPQARDSVLTFGVRDFAGRVLSNSEEQRYIARSLAKAIQTHEPRLTQVQVLVDASGDRSINCLSFTIRALLIVYPSREPVSFDAVLQPSVARFAVSPSRFEKPLPV